MIVNSKYNPNIHHRKSIRLKGYDYSQAGAYPTVGDTVGANKCLEIYKSKNKNYGNVIITNALSQMKNHIKQFQLYN